MSYIKFKKNQVFFEWIIKERPTAFVLLSVIAFRAKRSNHHPDRFLEIGESKIGDYKGYGVTEQTYRSDKNFLETNGIVTTRTTNKGTIAKLISTEIFDINEEKVTNKLTDNQRTTNGQLTTNNNVKNVKKVKKVKQELTPQELWEVTKHFKCSYLDVKEKYKAILESIENGDKYKVVSLRGTLSNWVRMGIEKGVIEVLDPLSFQVEAQYHDPVEVAKMERFKLKIMEDEKNGKPFIDLNRFKN